MFSECKDVIGLENGAVLDSMISASSSYHVDHTGPERARLNWVYGKFYFDIIYIILAQRGQDSIGYMVSSTLTSFISYWPREGKTQLGIW